MPPCQGDSLAASGHQALHDCIEPAALDECNGKKNWKVRFANMVAIHATLNGIVI